MPSNNLYTQMLQRQRGTTETAEEPIAEVAFDHVASVAVDHVFGHGIGTALEMGKSIVDAVATNSAPKPTLADQINAAVLRRQRIR